jgi:SAM-dependent methyltransferase
MRKTLWRLTAVLGALALTAAAEIARSHGTPAGSGAGTRQEFPLEIPGKDVPYVPTPENVVEEMLRLARPTQQDLVYDLGSGDGRILITAAKKYGARGIGVDIDPRLVREARENAEKAGVAHLVTFREGDLFRTDLREATIVTLYLLPSVNLRLRPKLFQELAPGTRIVSHNYNMGDWQPEQTVRLGDHFVYFWTISGLEKLRP